MTLMQLDGDAGVLVRAGNIQVTLAVEPSGVPVELLALEAGGTPLRTARRTVRDVVVERPRRAAILRVAHPGATFPDGTHVGLVLTIESPGDPDVVRVPPVFVSGLATRDVIRIEPEGDLLRIRPGASGGAGTRRLSPLGAAAVAETHRLAGGAIVPVSGLRVVLDPSASMRRFAHPDELGAVLEVLTGFREAVAGAGTPFEAAWWSDPPRVVPTTEPAALGEMALAALEDVPVSVGFRSAGAAGAGMTIVVTDAVPPDALVAAGLAERAGSGPWCVVVLGASPGQVRAGATGPSPNVVPSGPGPVVVPVAAAPPGVGGLRAVFVGGGHGPLLHALLAAMREGAR